MVDEAGKIIYKASVLMFAQRLIEEIVIDYASDGKTWRRDSEMEVWIKTK